MARYVYGPKQSGQWNPGGGPVTPPDLRDAEIIRYELANTPDGVDATIVLEPDAAGVARPVMLHVGVTDQMPPDDPNEFLTWPAVLWGSASVMDGSDSHVVQLRNLAEGVRQIYQVVVEYPN